MTSQPLTLTDARGQRWIGQHRTDAIDLTDLFAALASQRTPGGWSDTLPAGYELLELMRPSVARVRVPGREVDLVVKMVLPGSAWPLRRLTQRVRKSRARRAYRWSARLSARGVDTPRPLGYLERTLFPARNTSYLVTEFVEGTTLRDISARSNLWNKAALTRRLAALLRRMHDLRILHADVHGGNMLVTEDRIWLLDLESIRDIAVRRWVVVRTLSRLDWDFRQPGRLTNTDRMRFLKLYLGPDEDRSRRHRLFRIIARKTARRIRRKGVPLPPGTYS